MNAHKAARPKGPKGNRPGRQAGISVRMKSSAEGAALNQKHISGHIRFRGGRAGPGVLPENRIDYGAHPDCEYSLDSEIGVWMQGAAPSALIFMLTIFPGLTAGAIHWRPFGPQTTCAFI